MMQSLARLLGGFDRTTISVRGAPSFRMRRRADRVTGRRRPYELASLQLWVALCRSGKGAVIDVGAYSGVYAHVAAAACPDKVVYAFEPFPPVFDRLCANIEFSGLRNITPLDMAVTDREGQVDLLQQSKSPMTTGSSIIEKQRTGKKIAGRVTVPATSLDAFVGDRNVDSVVAVKIDVEGAEHLAVAGMMSILEKCQPHLVIEILHVSDAETVDALLSRVGYRFYGIGESDFTARRLPRLGRMPRPRDRNFLCTIASDDELARLCDTAGLALTL